MVLFLFVLRLVAMSPHSKIAELSGKNWRPVAGNTPLLSTRAKIYGCLQNSSII